MASMRCKQQTALLGVWTVMAVLTVSVQAQVTKPATRPAVPVPDVAPSIPTPETLQSHITRITQAKDLEQSVRTQVLEAYKQALAQLKVSGDWQGKAGAFAAAAKEAPAKLALVTKSLETAASQPTATAPADATLAQLEQVLSKANAELAEAKKTAADLAVEPKRRADRRLEIAKLTTNTQQALGEIDKTLADMPPDRHPELAGAQRALIQAQKEAIRQELETYQKELASYDAERDLLTARADLAARQVSRAEARVKQLQVAVDAKRKEEADRAAREADAAAARLARDHPALRAIAEENAALANERSGPDGLAAKIPRATGRLDSTKATLGRLEQEFKGLVEKEKVIGKTATYGVLLRKQRAELPDLRDYQTRIKARQAAIAAAQLRLIELQDQRAALADVDAAVRRVLADLNASVLPAQRDRVVGAARELLEARRKTIEDLIRDHETHFGKLVDLDLQARALVAKTEQIADYIGERVLWIRSGPSLQPRDVPAAFEACQWFLGPQAWVDVGAALLADARTSPVIVGVGLLAFAALLAVRKRLVRRLERAGDLASKATTGTFGPTALAVLLTAVLAATLPALIWFISWRLAGAPAAAALGNTAASGLSPATDHPGPAQAVAAGLSALAAVLLTFGAIRQVCRPKGLAEAHFHVSTDALGPVRRVLLVLIVILSVACFLISGMEWQGNEAWKNSLGRGALIIALAAVAVFAHRLLRPSGRLWAAQGGTAGGWLRRLRTVWYLLATAAPAALAVLAVVGYYYTALHLTGRLVTTFWLVASLAVLGALVKRWLAVAVRRLTVRRLRREGKGRAVPHAATDDSNAAPVADPEAELTARLDQINSQNQRLVETVMVIVLILGTWAIWADSLPALGALRRVELWTYTTKVATETPGPDGTAIQQMVDKIVPVTLADLGLCVLVVILTFAATRNIPGLLEVAVLQRIRMDSGARYATTAVLRYIIAVVGVVLAFKMLGVGWSSVQWLVAAMTVGLGFGLQEIFANFVSGLIILFERPIRIGDTVTVGETAGTVTRIRIRATTITDWDRKELIVPNKEFVTGRLVNWSLSDRVLRVIMRVGIAYGSDTELAEKVLYEKAAEHPLVLKDPEPRVLFSAFGDNSLNFELRVYISGIEHYLEVWHDLNMAIDKAFRKAGITIAFPQRDTHLDTLEPLEIRILPADEVRPVGSVQHTSPAESVRPEVRQGDTDEP